MFEKYIKIGPSPGGSFLLVCRGGRREDSPHKIRFVFEINCRE
jgi:hypothetical protein